MRNSPSFVRRKIFQKKKKRCCRYNLQQHLFLKHPIRRNTFKLELFYFSLYFSKEYTASTLSSLSAFTFGANTKKNHPASSAVTKS